MPDGLARIPGQTKTHKKILATQGRGTVVARHRTSGPGRQGARDKKRVYDSARVKKKETLGKDEQLPSDRGLK
jgi:hypothetical protein